jgi:Cytochrome c3/Cytochrome c554 and c-prime
MFKFINKFNPVLLILSMFVLFSVKSKSQEFESKDMCFNCHSILDGKFKAPADMYKIDVHFRKGIACSACHGGDSKEEDMDKAMNQTAGFIGVPHGSQVSRICAKCHSDEFKTLSESVHGEQSTGKGTIINNCVTCHGIHNIVPVKSPSSKVNGANIVNTCASCHNDAAFIKKYNPGLRVDQLEQYKTSVHGKRIFEGDTKVANCASCHGNHDIKPVKDPQSHVYPSNIPGTCNKCHGNAEYMKGYNIPTDQYEKYKSSVHGIAVLEKGDKNAPTCNNCHGDHGAAPPEVESIGRVCGTCHVLNEQMFEQSPHKEAFQQKDLHECAACHSNHAIVHPTDDMLGAGDKSFCIKCHQTGDKGLTLGIEMKHLIDSLNNDVNVANYFMDQAEQKGMDISDARFDYNDIKKVLITTRTSVHYSSLEKYEEAISEGFKMTNKAKIEGQDAINEYYFRRAGLGVSTLFITIIAVALYIKLRKIEKKKT